MTAQRLWEATITTPHGPATDKITAQMALTLCDLWGVQIEERDPPNGVWAVGFPPEQTVAWTLKETGGGVIWPGKDTDGRLWIIDVPIRS